MMTDELQDYSLARTGRAPLAFRGEFLAGVQGEDYLHEKTRNPRWHDLALFRTRGGRYVLHVQYRAEFKDEVGHDEAFVCESPADVASTLTGLDPTDHVKGYPPGVEHYEEKQGRLLDEVVSRYNRAVADLLVQLGPEFAEEVE